MRAGAQDEDERAANEAAFREANEAIRSAERRLEPPLERVPYLCECDDVDCREQIPLTATEYERIRGDGAALAIIRGHPSQGEVIEEHAHYAVVRKPGDGGEVARALDPRREAP